MMAWAGRIVALALIGAGMFIGWSGLVQMGFVESAVDALLRMVAPGLVLILLGVALEEIAWKARKRR